MRISIPPASPSSMPSCRRSATRGCSAPLRGSTGATASRNICATSRGSGPISAVRWRTPRSPAPGLVRGQRPSAGTVIYRLLASPALIVRPDPAAQARGARLLERRSKCMATTERRKGERVTFERGIPAHMMGIDGTWRRDCTMEDVSETGAQAHRRRFGRGAASEGILPAAVVHGPRLSPLRAVLGQWRPDRRQFPETRRQEEKGRRRSAQDAEA